MRKDVKLGFAVGGVLLAVLIVYASVVGRSDRSAGNRPGADTTVIARNDAPVSPSVGRRDSASLEPTGSNNADPFATNGSRPQTASNHTESPSVDTKTAPDGMDWSKLLANGPVKTITPDGLTLGNVARPAGDLSSGNASSGAHLVVHEIPTFDPGPATRPSGNTTATSAAARTHVVVEGETFSTISMTMYGTPRYFNVIAKANPEINPSRLKIGTKLNIPDLTAPVRPAAKPADTNVGANEYRVAQGDNLYRISVKLYGKGDRADKIYALNKQAIGPDSAKLKLNMVLKLPEAPTVGH